MIYDSTQMFSDAQALTATGVSTNVIDFGVARDMGKGEELPLSIRLIADMGGTTPTIQATIQVSMDAAFTTPINVASSQVITSGVAGDRASLQYMPITGAYRYMRINYTLGGTAPTASITAGIVAGHQD